jgi:hypothetical protein
MLNTPPPPPPDQRDTDTLVEDLCVALRNVGVHDSELPDGARVLKAIEQVRTFHQELVRRGVGLSDRLEELSQQTRWRMGELLDECLRFPAVMPYVKEMDGVRRYLRCGLCGRAERPVDPGPFWMCDGCMRRTVEAIDRREPTEGVVLFRTYNPDARCGHADAETVLAAIGWYDVIFGNCRRCFEEELSRRAGGR